MMNYIIYTFRFLGRHSGKIGLTLLTVILFLFLLFPAGDLNDSISSQVATVTNSQIYPQFDDMVINPLGPSITLRKLTVDTPTTSTLEIRELSVRPGMGFLLSKIPTAISMALLNAKGEEGLTAEDQAKKLQLTQKMTANPEGRLSAHGIMGGDIDFRINNGRKSENGADRSRIEIQAEGINLKDLREFASLSLPFKGKANLSTNIIADLTFSEQPEGELNVTIQRFELPSSSLSLGDMGAVTLPEIKFAQVELKGNLVGGKFQIESGKLGNNKDEFYGEIKGQMGLTFVMVNGKPTPQMGAYNLDIDLTAAPQFEERAKFFLSFLEGYKTNSQTSRYRFKIQAANTMTAPSFSPLR